jgi:hypothetical protein
MQKTSLFLAVFFFFLGGKGGNKTGEGLFLYMFDAFFNVPTNKCNMAETARCEKKTNFVANFL